ncbi:hypothetical protein HEK616_44150 [Streptomyces nigrescens]|uniref:Uncharacterized protein n=1 Tax=Streptomyces nigrescens TaxID=1920 RepID=A0ABN6R2V7_STRNI|nr:hypothetical protein HEK616_44150 [Streptomyces nigrescens]
MGREKAPEKGKGKPAPGAGRGRNKKRRGVPWKAGKPVVGSADRRSERAPTQGAGDPDEVDVAPLGQALLRLHQHVTSLQQFCGSGPFGIPAAHRRVYRWGAASVDSVSARW